MSGIFGGGLGLWVGMVILVIGQYRNQIRLGSRLDNRAVVQQLLAEELGFLFRQLGPVNVLGWGNKFQLTRAEVVKSESAQIDPDPDFIGEYLAMKMLPTARNILHRKTSDMEVAVFDFASMTGNREMQTVVAIKSHELWQPYWRLEPKSVLKHLPDELMKNSTIAHRFILTTDQRDTFETVLGDLEGCISDDMTLESGEGFLLLYRAGQLADSEVIQGMLEMAAVIHEKLAVHFKAEKLAERFVQSTTQKELAH